MVSALINKSNQNEYGKQDDLHFKVLSNCKIWKGCTFNIVYSISLKLVIFYKNNMKIRPSRKLFAFPISNIQP